MLVSLLFFATLGLSIYVYLSGKRKLGNFPKGPTGLPIIGNVHQLDRSVHEAFAKLRDIYGDIFSITLGSLRAIVLHDPKHIKEAFGKEVFSGRPIFPHFREQETGIQRGIILSEGEAWEEQRRFTIKTLRDFGLKYGSRNMEVLIQNEVQLLIDGFVACAGKPIQTNKKFGVAVINALWIIVSGERFEHNDPRMENMLTEFSKMTTSPEMQGALVFFPWFAKMFPTLSGLNQSINSIAPIYNMIEECVTSHKRNNRKGDKLDFIDCYIEEMEKPDQKKLSFIGEDADANLITIVRDAFMAGVETTSTALTWICLLMAHYPDMQKKVADEMNKVVGTARLPCLDDRPSMPYCEAVILECLRFITIIPLGVFHSARRDAEFQGYKIPKGTLIIANLWFVDHDPRNWNAPDTFNPQRFLSDDGKSVIRHEASTPFSTGKRVCPGEGLARDQLFLFSTAIFQRLEVGFVPGGQIPPLKNYEGAAFNIALPHELQMKDKFGV